MRLGVKGNKRVLVPAGYETQYRRIGYKMKPAPADAWDTKVPASYPQDRPKPKPEFKTIEELEAHFEKLSDEFRKEYLSKRAELMKALPAPPVGAPSGAPSPAPASTPPDGVPASDAPATPDEDPEALDPGDEEIDDGPAWDDGDPRGEVPMAPGAADARPAKKKKRS